MALQTYKVELQASAERHRAIARRANIDFKGRSSKVVKMSFDPDVPEDAAALEALGNPAPLPPIVHVKVALDASIPEHAAVLERFERMSGRDAQEWIRLHLFRAVMDVEARSESARHAAKVKAGQNKKKTGRAEPARSVTQQPEEPAKKPPAFGAIPGIGG